jgi:hypothetical protein
VSNKRKFSKLFPPRQRSQKKFSKLIERARYLFAQFARQHAYRVSILTLVRDPFMLSSMEYLQARRTSSLFVWLVAEGWCWFVLREKVLLAGCR